MGEWTGFDGTPEFEFEAGKSAGQRVIKEAKAAFNYYCAYET